MHSQYPYKFDVSAIFETFGGIGRIEHLLQKQGATIHPKSLQKWRERKEMPIDAVATLLMIAEEEGIPFSVYSHVVRR